jgi:hypothetical protein
MSTKTRRRPQAYKGKTFGPTSDFKVDKVERAARKTARAPRRQGTKVAIIRAEIKAL